MVDAKRADCVQHEDWPKVPAIRRLAEASALAGCPWCRRAILRGRTCSLGAFFLPQTTAEKALWERAYLHPGRHWRRRRRGPSSGAAVGVRAWCERRWHGRTWTSQTERALGRALGHCCRCLIEAAVAWMRRCGCLSLRCSSGVSGRLRSHWVRRQPGRSQFQAPSAGSRPSKRAAKQRAWWRA